MNPQLEPADLARRLASNTAPRLLDVRQPEEHALAALPGARLIPLGELPERLDELADWQANEIVVYCHHGIRSLHAISLLRQSGFQNLANLSGGIDRWSLEIDPSIPRY